MISQEIAKQGKKGSGTGNEWTCEGPDPADDTDDDVLRDRGVSDDVRHRRYLSGRDI